MHKSRSACVPRSQNKPTGRASHLRIQLERQLHPEIVRAAATKTVVPGVRRQNEFFLHFLFVFSLQTSATRLRSARRTPRCRFFISTRSKSASVTTPRVSSFSSRFANPSRNVFGRCDCT